ncbi:MAG: hypothetical protein EA377_08275 [Phycisphaerales bacterium]|nr:MAG: hypothetical protein EA377_08275 [Phycisphaerales bacterium]
MTLGESGSNASFFKSRGIPLLVIGILLIVIGIAGGGVLGWMAIMNEMTPMQRAVFPGSERFTLEEAGPYTISHEFRSVIDGRMITSPRNLPPMRYELRAADDGRVIALEGTGGIVTYQLGGVEGEVLMSFEVDQPGEYVLEAVFEDGSTTPPFVLAIRQGSLAETTVRIVTPCCGGGVTALAGFILVLIVTIGMLQRRAAKADSVAYHEPSSR